MFMNAAGDANKWAEFGLAGLVIFALFALLFYVIRESKSDRIMFAEAVKETQQQQTHSNERLEVALRDLSNVIHSKGE